MSSEATDKADGDAMSGTDDGTDLDRPFVVRASGPVEYRCRGRASADITEVRDIEIEIERELSAVEEFERIYDLRETTAYTRNAIEALVEDCDGYKVPDDLSGWEFEIDGPVEAYHAVGDALSKYDGPNPYMRRSVAKDCARSDLFGPGATIALLAARRDSGSDVDIEQTVEAFVGDGR